MCYFLICLLGGTNICLVKYRIILHLHPKMESKAACEMEFFRAKYSLKITGARHRLTHCKWLARPVINSTIGEKHAKYTLWIQFSYEEWNCLVCRNTNGLGGHCAKWNLLVSLRQTSIFSLMWNLGKNKNMKGKWGLLGVWKEKWRERIRKTNGRVNVIKRHCMHIWEYNDTSKIVQLI